MPASLARSSNDERAWQMAKEQAASQVDSSSKAYWSLVMTLYKRITGRESLTAATSIRLLKESRLTPAEVVSLSS